MTQTQIERVAEVYRMQDAQGRGPFKPGMSKRWVDEYGEPQLPTFIAEFGPGIVDKMRLRTMALGGACGCGCSSLEGLKRWFTATERERLHELGYQVVKMNVDHVFAESENQIVFWRQIPLCFARRLEAAE